MWVDSFLRQVRDDPQRPALWTDRGTLTYGELHRHASNWAAGAHVAGVRHLFPVEHPEDTVVQVIGCWLAGGVPVPVHRSMPPATIERLRERLARPIRPESAPNTLDGEGVILATSGTTGLPKLVVLPHRALAVGTAALGSWAGLPAGTQQLVPTTMARTSGLLAGALLGLSHGWTVHAFEEGTAPPAAQAHIRHHKIAFISAQPSFFRLFLSYWNGQPFEGVSFVRSGGEPASQALIESLYLAFPRARIFLVLGLTETTGRVANIAADDPRVRKGAAGFLMPHFEHHIEPVPGVAPPGGELRLRSPTLFLGYLREDGGYDGLEPGGWFRTRDLVRQEADGCLFHLGRRDGLVKSGAFLVNPAEVAIALRNLPGVAEARCVAEPHAVLGTALAAEIVLLPGVRRHATELRKRAREVLEGFQVPRKFRIVAALPQGDSGKIALAPAIPEPA